MQPAIIKGHTRQYTAPVGRPEVATLFVREEVVDGHPVIRSAWDAEQKEVGLLLAGAKVVLGIVAEVHPVVNLGVTDLPDDFDPVFTARRFRCPTRGNVARVEALVCAPPEHIRFWAEEPIVVGFGDAFASAIASIEARAREKGIRI